MNLFKEVLGCDRKFGPSDIALGLVIMAISLAINNPNAFFTGVGIAYYGITKRWLPFWLGIPSSFAQP